MIESVKIKEEDKGFTNPLPQEIPICSFSGNPADFYVGLSSEHELDEIRIVGAISEAFVETAILNVFGQGVDDVRWPVILDLEGNIFYHSFRAHSNGFSAIMGWKELLASRLLNMDKE